MSTQRKDAEELRDKLQAARDSGHTMLVFEGPLPIYEKGHCEIWAGVRVACFELVTLVQDGKGWREEDGFLLPLAIDFDRVFAFAASRKRDWGG
jgi:hypothetical protein